MSLISPAIRRLALLTATLYLASAAAAADIGDIIENIGIGGLGVNQARTAAQAMTASGNGLAYRSYGLETNIFTGSYTMPAFGEDVTESNPTGNFMYGMAIFSDDGCDVTVDDVQIHSRGSVPQALPTLADSFQVLPVLFSPEQAVNITVRYTNVRYTGKPGSPDIDGCVLFLFKVPVNARILQVSFAGEKYHELKSDDGATTYSIPHWLDGNEDGNINRFTNGDRNYPVAFTRNSQPSVGATVFVAGLPYSVPAQIKATSPQGLQIISPTAINSTAYSSAFLNGRLYHQTPVPSSVNLDDAIQFYNADDSTAFQLDWQIKIGASDWFSVGSTKHTVYVTRADPIKTANDLRRETLFYLGCEGASGFDGEHDSMADQQAYVDFVYGKFQGRHVQKVKPSTGTLDGVDMTYWGNPRIKRWFTDELLAAGDGRCGAWCRMFIDVLRTQGIDDAQMIGFQAPELDKTKLESDIFAIYHVDYDHYHYHYESSSLFVENWTLTSNPFNPIRGYGIGAQGNGNPATADFSDHTLVKYNGKLYDPSYGLPTRDKNEDWEDASIAAFGSGKVDITLSDTNMNVYSQFTTRWIWKPDTKLILETKPDYSLYENIHE